MVTLDASQSRSHHSLPRARSMLPQPAGKIAARKIEENSQMVDLNLRRRSYLPNDEKMRAHTINHNSSQVVSSPDY